jgi:O-antigen/teichoic acid export membrane protein
MSVASKFVLGMFTGAFSVVLKTGLNIVTVPLLLANLGATPYSLFVLLINLLELAILLDMGFSEGTIKLLGEYRGKGQETEARQLLGTSKTMYLGLALLAQLLGFVLRPLFTQWIKVPPELLDVAQWGLLLITIEISVGLLLSFCRAILNSHSLQAWNNMTDSMYHIVGNGLGLAVLCLTPWGIPGFLAARLAAALVRLAILGWQVQKLEPQLWQYPWHPPALRRLFGLSAHALLINFSIFISHSMDQMVIGRFMPLAMIAPFEVVFRCLAIVSQLGSKLCEGLMPLFSRMSATNSEADKTRFLFLKMSFVNNAVTCLLLMMIGLHFPLLFSGFSSGKLQLADSLPVLYVAVGIFWSGALQLPASYYLYSSGHHQFLTVTSLITAFSNLVLSVLLVKQFGLVGVALGTLIPNAIQHQLFLIPKVRQIMGIPLAEYAREVHWTVGLPVLVAGAAVWGIITALQPWLGANPALWVAFGLLSVNTLIGGGIALMVWLLLTAPPADKALALQILKQPGQVKTLLQSAKG